MDAPPSDRYERVRDSLLHIGLRQITEEPSSDQAADFARRRARFKEHRQKLDDYRATQRAARVAEEEGADSELRARLNGVNKRSIGCSARQAPKTPGIAEESSNPPTESRDKTTTVPYTVSLPASSSDPTRLETTMSRDHPPEQQTTTINTLTPRGHATFITTSPSSSTASVTAPDDFQTRTAALPEDTPSSLNRLAFRSAIDMSASTDKSTEAKLVDRTKPGRTNTTTHTSSVTSTPLSSSSTLRKSHVNTENGVNNDTLHNAASVVGSFATTSRKLRSRRILLVHRFDGLSHTEVEDSNAEIEVARENTGSGNRRLDEEIENGNPALDTGPTATHPGCTSKHFRVRSITGRKSIDGDTYYIVSWKSSWVPSDQIFTSDDGQDRLIKIDGKDWLIAETIKRKIKKGVHKQLVRWVDDTLEPVKRLRRALSAIREFEMRPRLDRRLVSFDEASFDLTKILPQSDEEFREAQIHLAKKWPMIEPRNDIDLLPAFRQIIMEMFPRPEDENSNRKTHQRLIDLPQRRRLRWNEEYVLGGRFYENTLPRRNALLLQVVAEVAEDGCCERCVSDTAPFRECVRDTSEESPWFNGACANCGAAEANSTCFHHRVGTAHLERGRSSGLTSERLREFIDPTRSISLLSNLEYENDDDSDTFSADSYAESDSSSIGQPETGDDDFRSTGHHDSGHVGDSIDDNFWTPNHDTHDTSKSAQNQSATGSNIERNEQSPALSADPGGLSRAPNGRLVRKRFMFQDAAALPTPGITQGNRLAATIGSSTHASRARARKETTPVDLDRSSVTLAAESLTSKLFYDGRQDDHGDDGSSELPQYPNHRDILGNEEFMEARGTTSQRRSTRTRATRESTTATNSSPAVVQSVEAIVQASPTPPADHAATATEKFQVPPAMRKGKKRAASRPSAHQRASNRPNTESSRSYHGTSPDSPASTESHRSEPTSAKGVTESVTETKIDRGHTHEGCRVNWPCRDPNHVIPDTGALVPVYRDKIDPSRSFTLSEVMYILSRCTCHWAGAFSKVWDGWREGSNTPEDAELTKPQFLLTIWPEFLLEAARECCPSDPAERVTIIID